MGSLTTLLVGLCGACTKDRIERIDIGEQERQVKVDIKGAIAGFENQRVANPGDHLNLWRLAKAREKLEQWQQVASLMAEASELAPEFANYWYEWGYALFKGEHYEEARAPLSTCVQKDPNYAGCHYYLALANERLDEPTRAVNHYFETLRVDPRHIAAYTSAAHLCFAYGHFETATSLVKAAEPFMGFANEEQRSLLLQVAADLAVARDDWQTASAKLESLGTGARPSARYFLALAYARVQPAKLGKAEKVLTDLRQKSCPHVDEAALPPECRAAAELLFEVRSRLKGRGEPRAAE